MKMNKASNWVNISLVCILASCLLNTVVLAQQSFTTQPSNTNVAVGGTATLLCTVQGKEGALQWLKDSAVISSDDVVDGGLVDASRYSITGDNVNGEYNLQIIVAESGDAGDYLCQVTAAGSSGLISSAAISLDVLEDQLQVLYILPASQTVYESEDVTLTCAVTNKVGELSWLKNGQRVNRDTEIDIVSDRYSIVGDQSQGEYFLFIEDVEADDGATYHCSVSAGDTGNQVTSAPVDLIILDAIPPDPPTCQVYPEQSDYKEGELVTMSCESQGGQPFASPAWSYSGQALNSTLETGSLGVRVDSAVTIAKKHKDDSTFTCTSQHAGYNFAESCTVGPLSITLNKLIAIAISPTVQEVEQGGTVHYQCNATTLDPDFPIDRFQWFFDNVEVNLNNPVTEGANTFEGFSLDEDNTVLNIAGAEKGMDGSIVSCLASNQYDQSTASATLTVLDPAEDTLTFKLVAAAIALVAVIVIVVSVIIFVIYKLWKKHQREQHEEKVKKDVERQVDAERSARQQDDIVRRVDMMTFEIQKKNEKKRKHQAEKKVKKEKKPKKEKKVKKEKIKKPRKSKVLDHNRVSPEEAEASKVKRRSSLSSPPDRYMTENTYVTIRSPVELVQNSRDGRLMMGTPHQNGGIPHPEARPLSRQDSRRSSSGAKKTKISLSPGEYQARVQYENSVREAQKQTGYKLPPETSPRKSERRLSGNQVSRMSNTEI